MAAAAGCGAAAHAASRGPGLRQMSREQQEAWHAGWELPGHHFQPQAQQAQQAAEQPEASGQQDGVAADAAWMELAQWDGAEEGEQAGQAEPQEAHQPPQQQHAEHGPPHQPSNAAGERGWPVLAYNAVKAVLILMLLCGHVFSLSVSPPITAQPLVPMVV